jgi:hypothetical protein
LPIGKRCRRSIRVGGDLASEIREWVSRYALVNVVMASCERSANPCFLKDRIAGRRAGPGRPPARLAILAPRSEIRFARRADPYQAFSQLACEGAGLLALVGLDEGAKHRIDAHLIARPLPPKPCENVAVEPERDRFGRLRPDDPRVLPVTGGGQ